MSYTAAQLESFRKHVEDAGHIVVMQAEHVDADSLGSSLGLECALTELGKKVTLFCEDTVPGYLQHMPGWDRTTQELPGKYDLAILVDSSTLNQLERTWSKHKNSLSKRPLLCIDHHTSTTNRLEGANIEFFLDETAGASGQQVVELGRQFGWHFDAEAAYALSAAIKADTVNLANDKVTARTFEAMGFLVDQGADLSLLRYNIEQSSSISPKEVPLKAQALSRTRFFHDDKIAVTYFTREEYEGLDDRLVIERTKYDLRVLQGVLISVVITERNGYSNASMRADVDVARLTAEEFDGGGHDRAASCRFHDTGHEGVTEQIVPVIAKHIDEYEAART